MRPITTTGAVCAPTVSIAQPAPRECAPRAGQRAMSPAGDSAHGLSLECAGAGREQPRGWPTAAELAAEDRDVIAQAGAWAARQRGNCVLLDMPFTPDPAIWREVAAEIRASDAVAHAVNVLAVGPQGQGQ